MTRHGARVLVIDDNAANLELALYLLRAFGYEAEGRSDGASGLEAARSGRFGIVLTDILMPGIDGYELARRFKSDAGLSSTPLVALTAFAMGGDHERIIAAGFDGCITKPIDPHGFVAEVESYLQPTSA
ncbi:MAG: response regulator [Candidatus Eremiobacteraeota bacterium]|nr:response regulator [Candidatus Eremiobacteraeota bacterium]MBV8499071.1 response regulator [Candidatus Eremiobacteraeota bacterium]